MSEADANRDPITGAPGAHPVGTGMGATGGAVAGAAAGTIAGPIGAAVGLVGGAIIGALAGKGVAERINPTLEDAHWHENYAREPYVEAGRGYDDYGPAFAAGWTERERYPAEFAAAEPELAARWESRRGSSTLSWDQARPAAQQSWERVNTRYSSADDVVDTEPMANDEVVDVLNDLLENCPDGEYGFRACADEVESLPAKQLFKRRAAGCRAAEAELLPLIAAYGGKPADGGTAGGALHRGWVHVKGSLGADSELSILESCERGEDTAIARYRKALKRALPAEVRAVVERQAVGAQRNHDEIRDLRNAARAKHG